MAEHTTSFERHKILQLRDEGFSISGISRETGFTRKTVRLWLTRYDAEGHLDVRHGPDRPRATTEAEDASIVARAKETPLTTATSIKHSLELNVSSVTVRKRLKEAGLKHHIPAVKEILTETHRRRRVQFARDHLNLDWENVVFSDEKMFSSEGPVNPSFRPVHYSDHFQMLIMNWYIFYRLQVIAGERGERGFSLKMSRNDFIVAGNRCPCGDGWREVEWDTLKKLKVI